MSLPLPAEMFEHADLLVTFRRPRPSQTDLRRAISSAYYGVFHLICTDAAGLFSGGKHYSDKPEGAIIYRSLEHKPLRETCKAIQSGSPDKAVRALLPGGAFTSDMKRFAAITFELQGERHLADYDPSEYYSAETARALIASAREAAERYGNLAEFERRAFLYAAIFKKR